MSPAFAAMIPIVGIFLLAMVPIFTPIHLPSGFQWVIVFASAGWAWYEARRIELDKYETYAKSPEFVLVGSLLLWIAVFPAFMYARQNILNGTAKLKPGVAGELADDATPKRVDQDR